MKHLGDISKINGAEIEPVDIITFGSPCQDLSVAGKRAGLEGARSGLFMEAVRIIKEMREATDGKYPTFALWENVPGAFSSNKGEDFRVVLEELIKIAEPSATMPEVPPFGWAYADSYVGDGWSLAYRVFDTQYWPRTPQRRRRIYLVADFRGQRAREVLFEREGLRGHLTESPPPRERVTVYVEDGSGAANQAVTNPRSAAESEIAATLYAAYGTKWNGNAGAYNGENFVLAVATQQGGAEISEDGVCPTVTAAAGMSGNNQPWIAHSAAFKAGQGVNARSIGWEEEKSPTIASEAGGNSIPSVCVKTWDARGNGDGDTVSTITGDHENRITDYSSVVVEPIPIHDQATRFSGKHGDKQDGKGNGLGVGDPGDPMNTLTSGDRHAVVYCMAHGQANAEVMEETSPTLNCNHEQPIVFDKEVYNSGECAAGGHYISEGGPAPTLRGTGHAPGVCDRYIVRRLTPTECARLQGFPDTWGHPDKKDSLSDEEYQFWLEARNTHAAINGKAVKEYTKDQLLKWYNKLHSDSAEYKMWGNGIALPPSLYCMQGIVGALDIRNEIEEEV